LSSSSLLFIAITLPIIPFSEEKRKRGWKFFLKKEIFARKVGKLYNKRKKEGVWP